ncbi:MAG: 16S rRNA (guanine(527)-N(7))-methyltransferase RsmG [Rhodobacteraceae bacterium]|nr:16S rRNA (guanine(527)-N(7))-methyltransferase RsmG [Paracoccaceae bacterium]
MTLTPEPFRLDVSRETEARLKSFLTLLRRWNGRINLVSRATLEDAWERHVVDSAQLLALCPEGARHWVDLGSGGGLPGVVIACLAAETHPDLAVTLIESDARKCVFLQTTANELGLSLRILRARIEATTPQQADVVSARALAPLDRLLPLVARHMAINGCALLPKGARHRAEITAALASWRFSYEVHPSRISPASVILKVEGLRRA